MYHLTDFRGYHPPQEQLLKEALITRFAKASKRRPEPLSQMCPQG